MDPVIRHLKGESKGTRRMVNNYLYILGANSIYPSRESRRKFRKIKRQIARDLRRRVSWEISAFDIEWELVKRASRWYRNKYQ